ncbi:MAG: hypothetical protein OXG15_03205 [Gammaproteobacteria bacterium]|nr:hypothetical protein [Gammaproteobacteria bacterium]
MLVDSYRLKQRKTRKTDIGERLLAARVAQFGSASVSFVNSGGLRDFRQRNELNGNVPR